MAVEAILLLFTNCKDAIASCLSSRRFALAHLGNEEKPMDMHIHNCYELYYSLAGGRQFFVDSHIYPHECGDLFVINPYEAHKPLLQEGTQHERIILCIDPDYLARQSTASTDLTACFAKRPEGFSHRVHLSADEQVYVSSLLHRMGQAQGFGADLMQQSCFIELMVLVGGLFAPRLSGKRDAPRSGEDAAWVSRVIAYINARITHPLTIETLAEAFYVSGGYLCRLFKRETGTTISKYITARRISLAKRLLSEGQSVHAACEGSGFGDYSHFIRVFGQAVGQSPKQYALQTTGGVSCESSDVPMETRSFMVP